MQGKKEVQFNTATDVGSNFESLTLGSLFHTYLSTAQFGKTVSFLCVQQSLRHDFIKTLESKSDIFYKVMFYKLNREVGSR